MFYKKLCYTWESIYKSILGDGNYDIKYNLNEWTKPTIGKLFVFDSLQDARNFPYGTYIFECEIQGTPIRPKKIVHSHYTGGIKQFWNLRQKKKSLKSLEHKLINAPKGTVLVDAVKITKLVG